MARPAISGGAPTEIPEPPPPRYPPVTVEVLAPVLMASGLALAREGSVLDLTGVGRAIHRREVEGYPAPMREEYRRLWGLLNALHERFGEAVTIRVLAPASPRWFTASLRHRVRQYPAFIVDGRERVTGWDEQILTACVEHWIARHRTPDRGEGGRS